MRTTSADTVLTRTGTSVLLAGNATINVTSASSNTREIYTNDASLANTTINHTIAGSTDGFSIVSPNSSFGAINFTDANNSRTLTLPSSG